jgi:hypothetical protein
MARRSESVDGRKHPNQHRVPRIPRPLYLASIVGKDALRPYPDFGALYLATAHALRHCRGAAEAKVLLVSGEPFLENEAVFHFMLACFDSALGHLDDAKEGLERAFQLDKGLRLKALDEPAPFWDSL